MPEVVTVDLQGRIQSYASQVKSIEFIQAQLLQGRHSPFALVVYKENGIVPHYGLRLDLHKRSFLDHFDDAETEAATQKAASEITEVIGQQLREQST